MRCFQGHLDTNIAAVVTRALIEGIRFMHSHCISHGDIKPENILVDVRRSNRISVKLCDFGLCSHLPKSSSLVCRDFSGTKGKLTIHEI
jgi:serine/threonine protein kinase